MAVASVREATAYARAMGWAGAEPFHSQSGGGRVIHRKAAAIAGRQPRDRTFGMSNIHRAGRTWPTFAAEVLHRRESLTLGESIGLALREHRRRLGVSQRAYAALRGVTKAMVGRFECRAELFRLADVVRILQGTGYRLVLVHSPVDGDSAGALRPVEPTHWDRTELVALVRGGSRRFPGHGATRQVSDPPQWWWQRESTVARSVAPNWYCPQQDDSRPA